MRREVELEWKIGPGGDRACPPRRGGGGWRHGAWAEIARKLDLEGAGRRREANHLAPSKQVVSYFPVKPPSGADHRPSKGKTGRKSAETNREASWRTGQHWHTRDPGNCGGRAGAAPLRCCGFAGALGQPVVEVVDALLRLRWGQLRDGDVLVANDGQRAAMGLKANDA